MTELAKLEKEVKKRKRIASEWAMQLHDLVEDRLPADFEALPALAESTYQACQEWQRAVEAFKQGESQAQEAS